MGELFGPKLQRATDVKVDPKYVGWARNPVLRPITLDMTRDALTKSWEEGQVDHMDMRRRHSQSHTDLEETYENARIRCQNGDTDSCQIEQSTELVLGSILQTGDVFSQGAISKHVEKISPITKGPNIQIIAYDDED